jgi:hypothetical protein
VPENRRGRNSERETTAGSSLFPRVTTVVGRPIRTPKAEFETVPVSQKKRVTSTTFSGIDGSRFPERVVKKFGNRTGGSGVQLNYQNVLLGRMHEKVHSVRAGGGRDPFAAVRKHGPSPIEEVTATAQGDPG